MDDAKLILYRSTGISPSTFLQPLNGSEISIVN